MVKRAYLFIGIDIHDEKGMAEYIENAPKILDRIGAQVLAVDSDAELLDGQYKRQRMVLIAFPSLEVARTFWNSSEYKPLKELRERSSDQDAVLIEGFDEQPWPAPGESPVFLIGGSDAHNPEGMKPYYTGVPPISVRYGVQVLAAGTSFDTLDGRWPHGQYITLRFPSEAAFKKFWSDPDYLPYKKLREDCCNGMHMMVRGF